MYTSLTFRLWAIINSTVVDVVQFGCRYAMNSIPKATAMLPVGVEAYTMQVSAAHALCAQSTLQVPIVVYITVSYGAGNPSAIVPVGTYPLFAGWITMAAYRRTSDSMNISVEMTHWLSALSFSSTLSASSHPSNPTNFVFNAKIPEFGIPAAGGALGHFNFVTMAQSKIDGPSVQQDLWGKCILPWFQDLAKADRWASTHFALAFQNPKNDSPNLECAAALGAFSGEKLPLDLKKDATTAELVAKAIAEEISCRTQDPSVNNHWLAMAHTTFWDKLVGDLAPTYGFSIIPFPLTAKVVPFVAGLRTAWDPWSTGYSILARDIVSLDASIGMRRPLRALGLYGGKLCTAGGALAAAKNPNQGLIGGMYVGNSAGMVIYRRAPAFFGKVARPSTYVRQAIAMDADKVRGNCFNHPGRGAAPVLPDPGVIKHEQLSLLDRYAHMLYINEVLRDRSGTLSSPIRFDICPGSTICIEGANSVPVYAAVVAVTYYLDAQHTKAGMTFNLTHLRSAAENQLNATSVDRHPLYDNVWPGDFMMPAFQNVGQEDPPDKWVIEGPGPQT